MENEEITHLEVMNQMVRDNNPGIMMSTSVIDNYTVKQGGVICFGKCITFDKNAQDSLPQHIKDKMKADREAVQNGGKSYICTNCKRTNVFRRKPYKAVSDNIAGYCKHCDHVIWVS